MALVLSLTPNKTTMITIAQALKEAETLAGETATLDAELLLCAALGEARAYLRVWPERVLEQDVLRQYRQALSRRQAGEPIAHILGCQAFWNLDLEVSAATLIPRQDTELLVEQALGLELPANAQVLDLGTGTGAIALAIAKERPAFQVTGCDYTDAIVALARRNAQRNGVSNASFYCSDWFTALLQQRYDLIVSNPPYIDPDDAHLRQGDLRFEAKTALVAQENGLADLQHIIVQAPEHLKAGAWLLLEHGFDQALAVAEKLRQRGFSNIGCHQDLGGNDRVSQAQWQPAD